MFEGRIGVPPRVPAGHNGFGYDPLFLVAPEYQRSSAELPPEEKNRLSHRGRAAAAMAEQLRLMQV
jgi:XTP/dITP diphosphohydrolase